MDALYPNDSAAYGAQSAAYTGTAGSTSGWPSGCNEVVVWATTDCHVRVGYGVTATTASMPIPAYTPVKMRVPPSGTGAGGVWRVSAIQMSAAGTLHAKPLAA